MIVAAVMVSIGGRIVAPAMVVLTAVFLCVGATAARPVAQLDVADWEEKGTAFRAAEEPMALVGPVAPAFTDC